VKVVFVILSYSFSQVSNSSAESDYDYDFCVSVHEDSAKKSVKINPFSGTARRLDGKACTQSVPETSSSVTNQQQTENATKYSNFKTPASRKTSGKLVFGSNVNVPRVETSTKVSVFSSNLCGATHNTYFHLNLSCLFIDMVYQIFFY